jgi:hypothetical protein
MQKSRKNKYALLKDVTTLSEQAKVGYSGNRLTTSFHSDAIIIHG